MTRSYRVVAIVIGVLTLGLTELLAADAPAMGQLQQQFRDVPMAARRWVGPLFWLHGDETPEQLRQELGNVLAGHNGTFTTEPRPHKDWLGDGWYRDLGICLDFARKNNLTTIIYDDYWWPSQMMGGRVPPQYGSKIITATTTEAPSGQKVAVEGCDDPQLIAVIAGRKTDGNTFDGPSLINLTAQIKGGKLEWTAPAGTWQVLKFRWEFKGKQGGQKAFISVDGASPDCVDWFIKEVYQPHYDRFKDDFGKTIIGYFYDEPETQGDWGSDVPRVIAERHYDLAKLLVAYKFKLAGEEQQAAFFQYLDCFAEAWGRTMYGGMSKWCREHHVFSMGHFMEHANDFYSRQLSGGNMMQLQKYSDMGGIDLVCHQVYPGERKMSMYQMPKIASSISHTYNKADDLAFCEIYGGYDQKLTYPQMKWLADWHQVRGVNFLIPHSFNPRAPFDKDFPPYFNNGGYEPRWPLYRVWADYTSRLSLMLTGGRHVCPVALIQPGQSYHVGQCTRPEAFTSVLQDAQFDCDWLNYDAWENDSQLAGAQIKLHKEDYRILVLPAVEVIPYPTLLKAKQYFEQGGVVVAYGRLPTKSATVGHTAAEISQLCAAIFGDAQPSLKVCQKNAAGGKSYFLPDQLTADQLHTVLVGDAGIHPTLELTKGQREWLHVLHRQKAGRDVFLVCNQDHTAARELSVRIKAAGEPECWDPLRGDAGAIAYRRINATTIEADLKLEPSESVLLVFQAEKRALPNWKLAGAKPASAPLPIVRDAAASDAWAAQVNRPVPDRKPFCKSPVTGTPFVGHCELPANVDLAKSRVYLVCEDIAPERAASVTVNGAYAGGFIERPLQLEVTGQLKPGRNEIRIEPFTPTAATLMIYPK